MIWPAPIERGDKIALVAASRRVSPAEIRPFLHFSHLQGWRVEYDAATLYASEGLLAGPDEQRLRILQQALDDPTLKAIWFARGGHGSSRIWPRLEWTGFQKHPKWLIGFSDVTPFLWGAVQAGVVALHAPVAAYTPQKTHVEAINQLLSLLREKESLYRLSWERKAWYAWREGSAQGLLLGGNLTLLQSLCGTRLDLARWPLSPLLFWEEVGEYYYRLDRMAWHLHNAGWYQKCQAVLIGELTFLRDDEDLPFGKSAAEIVAESIDCPGPVAMGLPVGHGFRNWPVPLGSHTTLQVTENRAVLQIRRE